MQLHKHVASYHIPKLVESSCAGMTTTCKASWSRPLLQSLSAMRKQKPCRCGIIIIPHYGRGSVTLCCIRSLLQLAIVIYEQVETKRCLEKLKSLDMHIAEPVLLSMDQQNKMPTSRGLADNTPSHISP